ncbi:MAG TPA: ArsA-related P-loop ATPase [Acidimicrobiales bacterium]|nr:ArsA-related P-loop ATPase [Acidimicrobiales bacterium]
MTHPLIDHRVLFVTGKGGVGKTTISAALAVLAASRGRRVLVCEVDAKGTLAAAFEAGPLRFEARTVHPGVSAMAMNTEDSLREYLRLYVRLPLVTRLGPLARTFDFVADAAPGVKEILTVGKVCYEVRERHYDLVVVDAAASGHIAGQLSAPWTINDLVQVGLVRDQTRWMTEILADPEQTGVVVVTTAEELPVVETIDLVGRLGATVPVRVAAVVVNRVLPELFTRKDELVFSALRQPEAVDALARQLAGGTKASARRAAQEDVTRVLDAAALAVALRRERAENLALLQDRLPAGLGTVLVPELFARSHGKRAVMQVAAALADELG